VNAGHGLESDSAGRRSVPLYEALRSGLIALGWVALAAEAFSFLIYFLAGRPFRPWSFVKIGWLYLLSFSRVGLRVTVGGPLSALIKGGVGGETIYTVHLAFLLGTALAAWLLFRAGRSAALRADLSPLGRAATGAAVAIPYAGFAFLGSFLAVVRFPAQGVPLIRPIPWQALVFPLLMAAACGAAGGLAAAEERIRANRIGRWCVRSVSGGWRGLEAGLVLSVAGLLVLAVVYPDSTGAYSRWLALHGRTGALIFAHQVLSLPNHAMFILAPAMGSCDTVAGGGHAVRMLCPGSFVAPQLLLYIPLFHGVPSTLVQAVAGSAGVGISSGSTPGVFRLFLLVPVVAATFGGRVAASGLRRLGERMAAGIGAGIVFAVLVGAVAWSARVALTLPPTSSESAVRVTLGPELVPTVLLALAWGIVGGALGGLSVGAQEGAAVPVPEPGEPVEVEPPSPTSV
jgi:hypothetical protein